MAIVRPLSAVRPAREAAAQVASVPYDVITTEEAKELAEGNPLSFLHVIRSEIDLPNGVHLYDDSVYTKAKENYQNLTSSSAFIKETTQDLYLYQQEFRGHVQTGVFGCVAVDEYDSGLIKVHEKTRQDKEDDRTRHLLELRSHAEPVFLAYKDLPEIDDLVDRELIHEPLYNFVAPDGIRHTLWKAKSSAALTKAFARVPALYIADGHHRSASASRAAAILRTSEELPSRETIQGNSEYDYFLAVIFPASQLRIMPYNRLILKSPLNKDELFAKLERDFKVIANGPSRPTKKGDFALYINNTWHTLEPRFDPQVRGSSVLERLDTTILQELVLAPFFEIADPRTSKSIDFVGGIRGTEALEKEVNSGRAFCAFSLYPVSMDELFAVADAGLSLPPKSTWFEPKLRSGLIIHEF